MPFLASTSCGLGKKRWNLETSPAVVEFSLCTILQLIGCDTVTVSPNQIIIIIIWGEIYRACDQSALTYETETWAMKADNLYYFVRLFIHFLFIEYDFRNKIEINIMITSGGT